MTTTKTVSLSQELGARLGKAGRLQTATAIAAAGKALGFQAVTVRFDGDEPLEMSFEIAADYELQAAIHRILHG